MNETILDELNRIRQEEAAKFKFDIDSLFDHYMKLEASSCRPHVSFPPQLVLDHGNTEALRAEAQRQHSVERLDA